MIPEKESHTRVLEIPGRSGKMELTGVERGKGATFSCTPRNVDIQDLVKNKAKMIMSNARSTIMTFDTYSSLKPAIESSPVGIRLRHRPWRAKTYMTEMTARFRQAGQDNQIPHQFYVICDMAKRLKTSYLEGKNEK